MALNEEVLHMAYLRFFFFRQKNGPKIRTILKKKLVDQDPWYDGIFKGEKTRVVVWSTTATSAVYSTVEIDLNKMFGDKSWVATVIQQHKLSVVISSLSKIIQGLRNILNS